MGDILKITITETLKPGTYVLTEETKPTLPPVTNPDPEPPKQKIPVFSSKVELGTAKLHLMKPSSVNSMGKINEVSIYPMSIVLDTEPPVPSWLPNNSNLIFYWTFRHQETSASLPGGTITLDGNESGSTLNDVYRKDDTFHALFEVSKEIIYATSDNGKNFTTKHKVNTHGARDTRHAFVQITDTYADIFGRTRGDDWGESVERWADRRGVKKLRLDFKTGATQLHGTIDPIDFTVGGRDGYKRSRIRPSFYSSDATLIGDTLLANIGVYFQDELRQTERKDRPNGTGPTFPVPFVQNNGKWTLLREMNDSLLDISKHTRPSANGDIEVGQIHAGSFVWKDGDLIQPYSVRNDTHYEFGEIPFKESEHFLARWNKGRLAYLTDGSVNVMTKFTSLEYDGPEPTIEGNTIHIPKQTKLYYICL